MTHVPDVPVAGVDVLLRNVFERDIPLPRVLNRLLAAIDLPQAPRCDHLKVRRERLVGEFKPNLVVSLPGTPVSHSIGTFQEGHINLVFGLQRAGNGGAQEVLSLVDGAGSKHREEVVGYELLTDIPDVELAGTGRERPFLHLFEVLILADVRAHAHHLGPRIVLLQPRNDD